MSPEKKEKVLHTRIPESLNEELREHASNLGISMSNLVRNVLQNTFGLVEDIVFDTANIARSASGQGKTTARSATAPEIRVLGWQKAVLNLSADCDVCNKNPQKGTEAAIAVPDHPSKSVMRCLDCLEELTNDQSND